MSVHWAAPTQRRTGSTVAMPTSHAPVIIVGAGPTGLALALLLARSGIRSTLVERHVAPQAHPAACILDIRTMEIFREIGIAAAILERCQDPFERARITWVTSLAGRELGHCSVLPPDLAGLLALSPVHATHYPQNRLEPLLWARVREEPLIEFLTGCECVDVRESATEVIATLNADGATRSRSADYVVACDGASGQTAREIGGRVRGRALQHMVGIYFRADLSTVTAHRKSILYWILNPSLLGVLIAHWLPDEWVLFAPYFPPQQSAGEFTVERCRTMVAHALGCAPSDLDIRLVRPWVIAARLADHFRRGRIFLAGDAAHSFPPTGGLGLNTGVQDAHNLAWKLAAVIDGGSHAALLDTYEQERRPVARLNLEHSVRNYERMNELTRTAGLDLRQLRVFQATQSSRLFRALPGSWQTSLSDAVRRKALGRLAVFDEASPRGARARDAFERAVAGQISHYRFVGLDLGFTYERGAFVPDGSPRPVASDPVMDYVPTTWPSARLPHFWVEKDGVRRSIHDFISPRVLTLLVHEAGTSQWAPAVESATTGLRARIRKLVIGTGAGADLLDRRHAWRDLSETEPDGAVLVRPDGHVAWRTRTRPDRATERLEDVTKSVLHVSSE